MFILTVFMAQFILPNGVSLAESIVESDQQNATEYIETEVDAPIITDSKAISEIDSISSTGEIKEVDSENSSFDIQTKSVEKAVAIASGTIGTANWELDDAGVLHIYGGTFTNSEVRPWNAYLSSINKIIFEDNVVAAQDSSFLFSGLEKLVTIENFDRLDTSNVTDMTYMFYLTSSLVNVDVSNFDTSNVTNMHRMFYLVSSLTSLDLNSFDTSNVTDMSYMFSKASNLTNLDLSNFDTRNVTNMFNMFTDSRSLTNLDVSSFDTSNVTNMSVMFGNVSSLTNLDLSNFDTSSVTDSSYMFYGTNNLSRLSLGSNFNFMDGAGLPLITTEGYTGGWIGLTDHVIFSSSIDLMANFDGTQHADTYVWEREIKAINDFTVSEVADETYTGGAHTPGLTVSDGSIDLLMDVDYTLSYQNNVNAGTATIIIKGIGVYSGTVETTFTINKAIPVVNELPTASTLDRGETLGDSPLIGGSVTGVESLTICMDFPRNESK